MTATTTGPARRGAQLTSSPSARARSRWRRDLPGWLFISPWLVGFTAFILGPIVASFYLSLTRYSALSKAKYIGLANYRTMVKDPLFWQSLYNTFYYAGFAVVGTVVSAFLVALLLSADVPGIRFFRTFFYVPVVVPVVANSLLWLLMFNDEGVVNGLLHTVGLPIFSWLGNPSIVKLVFVSQAVWGLGTAAMIFVAGLKDVPRTYYEAAEIDGAGVWSRMWNITLPLMAPVIFFNLVIGVINSFQVFTAAYVITSGGPSNASLFYVLYLYNNGFRYFQMGYASALAWVMFLIILVFTAIQFRLARSWIYYERS